MSASIWNPGGSIIPQADPNSQIKSEPFTATEGQTTFVLTQFTYTLGVGALSIFRNGVKLVGASDVTEVSNTTFSISPCDAGDSIEAVGNTAIADPAGMLAQMIEVRDETAVIAAEVDADKAAAQLAADEAAASAASIDLPIPVGSGGTGSTDAAGARTALDISAVNTPNTPAGNIAATNVQAAINELDTEKTTNLGVIKQTDVYVGASGGPVVYTAHVTGVTAYTDGMTIDIQPGATCGANPTLNINSLGAKYFFREMASGSYVVLVSGEIQQYHNQRITYLSVLDGFVIRGSTAKRTKTITTTRNMTAGSGSVSYTGVGFKPSKITAYAAVAGLRPFSIGVAAVGAADVAYSCGQLDAGSGTNNYLVTMASTTAAAYQLGVLASMDTDGFTLSWTLIGSPAAGTADIKFICEE